MYIINWIITDVLFIAIEVSLFRADKFVKFDEFGEKLPVHTKWLDGW